jgi:hypothetical protein
MDYKDFLYYIDESTNVIYFNPISTWESEGSLADSYTDEEDCFIEEVAKELGLFGSIKSGYEPIKIKNVIGYESKLLNLGFIYDKSFVRFMKSCLGKINEEDADLFEDSLDEPEELNFDA